MSYYVSLLGVIASGEARAIGSGASVSYVLDDGGISGTSNPLNINWPAGRQAGDLGILFGWVAQGGAISTPSGWTLIGSVQSTKSTNLGGTLYVFYKFWDGAETQASLTRTGSAVVMRGLMSGVRGAFSSPPDPIDTQNTNSDTNDVSTIPAPALNANETNSFVFVAGIKASGGSATVSTGSAGNLTSFTERIDLAVSSGGLEFVSFVYTGVLASNGSIGGVSLNTTNASPYACIAFNVFG